MKKFLTGFFVFMLVLCLSPDTSWSNSPPLIMQGDTAFPISNDNIRLESEVIKIHYNADTEHKVEVIFNFHNTGPDTELDIGFPNMASYAEKLRHFQAYDYPSMTPYETEIKDGGSLPEHDMYMYNSMYTWKMHFKEGEKKSLYVKYEFNTQQWGADYILATGALWKDRIDKIDVYVNFPEPATFAQITASPDNYYYNGKGIEWHFENIEPDFNLFVSLVDFPDYYVKKDEFYKPRMHNPLDTYKWDDCFYFIDTFVSYEYMGRSALYNMKDIDYIRKTVDRIKDTNQFVINEIYARHGYDFKSEEWEEIFEEAQWYSRNPQFSPDVFNNIERAIIAYIKCFDRTVITDVSDEELKQSLEDFQEKYNGKDILRYRDMVYPYYQYTYDLVSTERERIGWIDEMNEHNEHDSITDVIRREELDDEYSSSDEPGKVVVISEDRQLELHENGIFLRDDETVRCVFKYRTYQKISGSDNQNKYRELLESYPRIYDEITASPMGKYLLVGINYELDELTDIIGNKMYLVSVDEGDSHKLDKIGYGDFDDFKIWWSPSENIICWQDVKKEPDKLRIYNILERDLSEFDLPYDRITNLQVMDDGKILSQIKDTIYYMNSESGEINSTEGTITAVLDDRIYFYRGSDIYYAAFNGFLPVRVNGLEHSIWKSKVYSDNLYLYYGGAFNLSVFNIADNKLNRYRVDDYQGIIKPSPMGDRLFIYRDYENIYVGKHIREALALTSGMPSMSTVDAADDTAEWLDNDNLLIKVYKEYSVRDRTLHEQTPIAEYRYNVVTRERTLENTSINSFTSRVVNEFETGLENLQYEYKKEYSKLKEELKANAFTISENTVVYGDQRLLYGSAVLPCKGSLIGILEVADEGSRVCYFTENNTLYSGWVKNADYSIKGELVNPSQGFVYNAKVYEFDGEDPRQIFDSCSSQVRILDKKPGWMYINAVDRIFGWVREEDIRYGM